MRRFERALLVLLGTTILFAGIGLVVITRSSGTSAGSEERLVADFDSATAGTLDDLVSTSSSLPTPHPPPSDPRAPTPLVEVGQIEVPTLGLSAVLREGVTLTVIDHGPAHWPGSALPGQDGNVVIAGHRTIRTRPFHDIDRMKKGDEIIFHMPDGVHRYEVTESLIVSPRDLWITNPTPEPTVTLFACHPKGSAKQRYVVKGKLVSLPTSGTTLAPQP